MKANVVIVAALSVEFDAVLEYGASACGWDWESVTSERSIWVYRRSTSAKGLSVVLVQLPDAGPVSAGIVTADAIKDFSPDVVILVGIAGVYCPVPFGDIIVADETIYIEPGKVTTEGVKHELDIFPCDTWLVMGLLRVANDIGESNEKFEELIDRHLQIKKPDTEAKPTKASKGGLFCSTKVIADSEHTSKFDALFRKAVGVEMEAAGVASAVRYAKEKIRYVTVKSKSDNADGTKNDKWHKYAAATSAALVAEYVNRLCLHEASINGHIGEPAITEMLVPRMTALKKYEQDLVRRIVTNKIEEIGSILSTRYKSNLDTGGNFLLRAGPLFANASRIYAVSLDSVSKFWTDPANKTAAKEYLLQQKPTQDKKQVVRLFVFSNPDSAHRHIHVLDEHTSTYRNVFICSDRTYKKLVSDMIPDQPLEGYLNRDFAILHFEDTTVADSTGSQKQKLLAELWPDRLAYTDLEGEASAPYLTMLAEKLEKWKCHGVPGTWLESEPEVFRWQREFWKKTSLWKKCLENMFSSRTADAIHVLVFTANGRPRKQMIDILFELKKSITSDRSISLKEDIWIGQKIWNLTPRDYQCDGRISASPLNEGQFIMAVRFNTKIELEEFYDSRSYSQFRRKMYEMLEPSTKPQFEKIDQLKEDTANGIDAGKVQKLNIETVKARITEIYEAIEKKLGRHVTYSDYLDDELIDQIVLTSPLIQ